MRLRMYAGASVALGAAVLLRALSERANYYSAFVFLAQSNANLLILSNLALLTLCTILLCLQKLLYGPLRPIETEQLYEKAWFAITETCLAMTIFRGEIGGWFIVMFVSLLIGKVWGWIGDGRVEILEQQPPVNPRLFHMRLSTSLLLSLLFDFYMLDYCVETVLQQARPDMMVMFGFEFAVLSIMSTSTAARYAISLTEMYVVKKQKQAKLEERKRELREAREAALQRHQQTPSAEPAPEVPEEQEVDEMDLEVPGWEEKGRYVFYLDLTTDFLKLIVYLSFFFILLTFYGLPIHIMRDVFLTIRSFFKRIADFVRYRNATKDMNEKYPDATADEITREDTCIICREEMTAWVNPVAGADGAPPRPAGAMAERMRPKKLPCGHILHFACLRSWLERQQNCPTCRRPVLVTNRITVAPANPQGPNQNAPGAAGAGPQQPQLPGPNQPPGGNAALPEGQNRARIINFGPIRIGFGAGGGNLFHDLAQQVHNGRRGPAPAGNQGGPQQIGFGIGFGRPQAEANPVPAASQPTASIESQLQQVEQQLIQEINRLRLTTDQLRIVRDLQAQLVRLRIAQTAQIATTAPTPTVNGAGSVPLPSGAHPPPLPITATNMLHGTQALPAGDPNLPEGVTIPQGWTLMPLHRTGGPTTTSPPHVAPGPSTPGSATSGQNRAQGQRNSPTLNGSQAREVQGRTAVPESGANVPSASSPSHETPEPAVESMFDLPQAPLGTAVNVPPQTGDHGGQDLNAPTISSTSDGSQRQDCPSTLPNGAASLPSWGATDENGSGSQTNRGQEEWVDVSKDKESQEPAHRQSGEASAADEERKREKGKGRAATVEDLIDDVD